MQIGRLVGTIGAMLVALGMAAPAGAGSLVDMTYPFDGSTIYWPTATPFRLKVVHRGPTATGFWYETNDFTASEHGGTHMDAPRHFAKGAWSIDQIPLDVMSGPVVVVDISARSRTDRDAMLTVSDLAEWEKANGRIPGGAIVLLRTGWGSRWHDKLAYLGTDRKNDVRNLHFPSFGAGAAQFLVEQRKAKMVGVDTASVDIGQSVSFPCHAIFGRANVPALENLANLDRVPAVGATLLALPMKIGGGSGAPVRVVATIP